MCFFYTVSSSVSHGMNSVFNEQGETFSSDPMIREVENTTYDLVEASLIVVLDLVGGFLDIYSSHSLS